MAEPLPVTFGELLRQLRKANGLTMEALAARANVAVRTISDLELGKARSPHESTLARLAWGLRLEGPVKTRFEAAARGGPPDDELVLGGTATATALPGDIAAFTGRTAELTQLTQEVPGTGGVVSIYPVGGMPGVGKTALAVHVAHRLRDRFPDQQLFIDLHAHTPGHDPVPPSAALAGLLTAVGLDARYLPEDLDARAGLWRGKMAGQRALLVLDNAASSDQVIPLLPGSADCLVLVTSRRHLGDLPGAAAPVLLGTLPPDQARAMFGRLAARASAGPVAAVEELVELAGYLPLAISLLARVYARHPSWSLADLTRETKASMLTLAAEKHTVTAAFEVSYRYLAPGQQQFFRRLGLHPGTTIDAYAATALTGLALEEAAGQLEVLYGEGLLTETGYRRYGMHDLIRRYARDLAATDPAADHDQALGRLLEYYQHAAARADARLARHFRASPAPASLGSPAAIPDLPDRNHALSWARAERASLLACIDHASRTGQHARVVALTAAVEALLRLDGPWADAIARHTAALQAARLLHDPLGQAGALDDLGVVRRLTGDYDGAAQAHKDALGIYRDLGDQQGQANALNHLGTVRSLTDNYAQAARALQAAFSLYCDLHDQPGQADALNHLAVVRRLTGDYHGAGQAHNDALSIYRDLGDQQGRATTLIQLGATRRLAGDYPGAARALEEALATGRSLGSRQVQANALNFLGAVRQLTRDYPAAAAAQKEALAIFRDLGNRLGQANALGDLGTVLRLTEDYPAAARAQQDALSIYRDLGDRLGQGICRYELAVLQRHTGNYPAAAQALEEALITFHELGSRGNEAEALNEAGTLHRLRGDLERARACHQHALQLAREIKSTWNLAHALAGLARCALADGHLADAQASLQQAWEIFQQIGAAEATDIAAELGELTKSEPAT